MHRSHDLRLTPRQREKTERSVTGAVCVQAEGFHGELEEFLQWLRRTDSQLSAAKPTGGLPETAREQLQQHMVAPPPSSALVLLLQTVFFCCVVNTFYEHVNTRARRW